LSTHDCVIIPNFGAFIADYSPAIVSDEESTIPGKDILFNRQLTRNDGLLINALIEERGLEYSQAKEEIERYVATINKTLKDGEEITIDGIGKLALDEAGFVQFVADDSNTCLLDSYGLQAVTLEKINKEEVPPTQAQVEVKSRKSTRIVMRVASVAAVLALVLIFSLPLTDKPQGDYASLGLDSSTPAVVTNSTPVSKLKQGSSPDSIHKVIKPVAEAPTTQEAEPLTTETEAQDKILTAEKAYHIIIASLPNEQTATQYVQVFKNKYDFDAVEMISGSGRYRISVAHFDEKDEALAFVKSIRVLNPKFADAWVLPQSLN